MRALDNTDAIASTTAGSTGPFGSFTPAAYRARPSRAARTARAAGATATAAGTTATAAVGRRSAIPAARVVAHRAYHDVATLLGQLQGIRAHHRVLIATQAVQRNDQRIRLANNVRYFPHRIGSLRSQALNEWQMSFVKRVPFTSRVRGQINIELLNAFNQTIFAAPNADPTNVNFGKVTSQFNLPQSVQVAFKLVF